MERFPTLTPEQEATGLRLLRRLDAISLIRWTFEEAVARGVLGDGDEDVGDARDELRVLEESADSELWAFKQRHGIPDWEVS